MSVPDQSCQAFKNRAKPQIHPGSPAAQWLLVQALCPKLQHQLQLCNAERALGH